MTDGFPLERGDFPSDTIGTRTFNWLEAWIWCGKDRGPRPTTLQGLANVSDQDLRALKNIGRRSVQCLRAVLRNKGVEGCCQHCGQPLPAYKRAFKGA